MKSNIHNSCSVSSKAIIEDGVTIWHNTQVREYAHIGSNTSIGSNCYIGPGVVIGSGCKIQNNVNLYEPCEVGNFVLIGSGTMNTNHKFPRAFNDKLQAIGVGDWEKDKTVIEDYSSLGAGVICIGPTTVQNFVLVGAGSTVTGTLAKHGLYVGNIAKRIGWVGITGNRLQATISENIFLDLGTGHEYEQIGETLTKCP